MPQIIAHERRDACSHEPLDQNRLRPFVTSRVSRIMVGTFPRETVFQHQRLIAISHVRNSQRAPLDNPVDVILAQCQPSAAPTSEYQQIASVSGRFGPL
jgi:hypothetical protein